MIVNLKNIIGLLVIAFLASCGGNTASNKAKDTENATISKSEITNEVRTYVYPLPTAFELAEMLNRIGASYSLDLANEPLNVDKYFTEKSKALNLGVYSADLSYVSTYNQTQSTIDFLNASRRLIEELDIAGAVDADLVDKIQANENNKEVLIELISTSFNDTYSYLNENNRAGVAVLVVVGTYIEGLYIASYISDDTYNNKEMVAVIMKQKEPLNKLVELVKGFENDPIMADITTDLVRLQSAYEGVTSESIKESHLKAIADEVLAIRTKMIQ